MQLNIGKQQWLDWISEQEQSGLSVAAFCRIKTINLDNFYYHRGQQRKKSSSQKTRFVRAQLPSKPVEALPSPNTIKVVLGTMAIYLPLDRPLHTAELIKALQ